MVPPRVRGHTAPVRATTDRTVTPDCKNQPNMLILKGIKTTPRQQAKDRSWAAGSIACRLSGQHGPPGVRPGQTLEECDLSKVQHPSQTEHFRGGEYRVVSKGTTRVLAVGQADRVLLGYWPRPWSRGAKPWRRMIRPESSPISRSLWRSATTPWPIPPSCVVSLYGQVASDATAVGVQPDVSTADDLI